jgi:hypothetical protein
LVKEISRSPVLPDGACIVILVKQPFSEWGINVLVKWLWVSVFKVLVHPALLPISLATFISVAGPGGFAEIGHHVNAVPTVTVTPDNPPAIPNPPLFVSVVHESTPLAAAPLTEPEAPSVFEIADESPSAAAEAPATLNEVTETAPQINESPAPDVPPVQDDEPITLPTLPEAPVVTPADDGPSDDETGDAGDDGDPPGDDNPDPGTPPEDDEGTGEEDPGDGEVDNGDDVQCDPPGTGPEPHDGVPPGHDQNGDGIDDRCQDDESGGQDAGEGNDPGTDGAGDDGSGDGAGGDSGTGDTGTGDTGTGDTGTGDIGAGNSSPSDSGANDEEVPSSSGADVAECDPPGNGHENHGTPPPGHDKNEDGIDDRCQDSPGNSNAADRGDDRKKNDDG